MEKSSIVQSEAHHSSPSSFRRTFHGAVLIVVFPLAGVNFTQYLIGKFRYLVVVYLRPGSSGVCCPARSKKWPAAHYLPNPLRCDAIGLSSCFCRNHFSVSLFWPT